MPPLCLLYWKNCSLSNRCLACFRYIFIAFWPGMPVSYTHRCSRFRARSAPETAYRIPGRPYGGQLPCVPACARCILHRGTGQSSTSFACPLSQMRCRTVCRPFERSFDKPYRPLSCQPKQAITRHPGPLPTSGGAAGYRRFLSVHGIVSTRRSKRSREPVEVFPDPG